MQEIQITLPSSVNGDSTQSTTTEILEYNSILIIGANGSGKSRFGWRIEELNHSQIIHRISAQRSLEVPENIQVHSPKVAEDMLLNGTVTSHMNPNNIFRNKRSMRWGNKPTTKTLNDIQYVMAFLASKENRYAKNFRDALKQDRSRIEDIDIDSPIETLIKIWNRIFKHRKLIFNNDENLIHGVTDSGESYSMSNMSDGERVAIYLMAQCLCASENTILILDEPEIHLHKSILAKLWDELEQARQDCTFVYITHDLNFASTRHNAKKIWIKEYQHENQWDWVFLSTNDLISDELKFQVLGSRLPVLFVEGTYSRFDYNIYSQVFKEHQVIPVGGCDNVIRLTNAFNDSIRQLHYLSIQGLIDRDNRNEEQIELLQEKGIYCINVAIVENLFLVPEVFKIIVQRLELDFTDKQEQLERKILEKLDKEFERICSRLTALEFDYIISKSFSAKDLKSKDDILNEVDNLPSKNKVDEIYSKFEKELKRILEEHDYQGMLQIYPWKDLPSFANGILGINDYRDYVLRLISVETGIVDAIRKYLPHISIK